MRTLTFGRFVTAILLSLVIAAGAAAQMPKYGATATAEKNVDFSRFATYSWTPGQPSANKTIDAQIIAAVDRELAAVGMTKAVGTPADVLTTYYSLSRTDVNLKAKPDAKGVRPEYAVGTLVVALLNPADRKRLLRLRVDQPIDVAPDQLEASINSAVATLFTKYPTRQKK